MFDLIIDIHSVTDAVWADWLL